MSLKHIHNKLLRKAVSKTIHIWFQLTLLLYSKGSLNYNKCYHGESHLQKMLIAV